MISMKYLWFFMVLIFMSSCSPKLKQSYSKLSKPERTWVLFHAFKAEKAYIISREALLTTDSIAKENVIGKDINGGQLDAFKHSFWMATLAQRIGKNTALRLGKAHEKGNYQTYKKILLEDGILPDKAASDMDLFNNQFGAKLGKQHKKSSKQTIINHLLEAIRQGKLRMLKKDDSGNFLDCKGQIIATQTLKGKWINDKCLIPTH